MAVDLNNYCKQIPINGVEKHFLKVGWVILERKIE